jgi:phosphatidylglycerol lysyltransferase
MTLAARLCALLVALVGIATIAQTFLPHYPLLLEPLGPLLLPQASRSLGFLLGCSLLYLALQLTLRKFAAWWLACIWLALAAMLNLRIHPALNLPLELVAFLALMRARSSFVVKSEISSSKRSLMLVAGMLLFALAYGIAGFYLLDVSAFGRDFNFRQSVVITLREYALLGNADIIPRTRLAGWFLDSVDLLGIISALSILLNLFRPLRYYLLDLPYERRQAREILRAHGRSSDDFFKLWPHDKSYWFTSTRQSFVAYKVCNNVAIALGGPSGSKRDERQSISLFMQFCQQHGWQPCFLYTLPESSRSYKQAKLHLLKIGEDAIVSLEHFVTITCQKKYFRYINRRFKHLGYVCEYVMPPHKPLLMAQLERVSQAWLNIPGRKERGFALGHFSPEYLATLPVFVVRRPKGDVVAFVNEIESFVPHRATIDLMRYDPGSPNGVMDFLFFHYFALLHHRQVAQCNLGLVPFSNSTRKRISTPDTMALRYLLQGRDRIFSFKGLRDFKAKYEPIWEARYLAYQGSPLQLIQVAVAIYRAMK